MQGRGWGVESLGGVGVTGVLAGVCGGGSLVGAGGEEVQRLCAPPQVLQRLQEGAPRPLLLQGRGALLLYLSDLSERHGLRLEASLAAAAGTALTPGRALGDRELLGELLHGRGQEVSGQDVEA